MINTIITKIKVIIVKIVNFLIEKNRVIFLNNIKIVYNSIC